MLTRQNADLLHDNSGSKFERKNKFQSITGKREEGSRQKWACIDVLSNQIKRDQELKRNRLIRVHKLEGTMGERLPIYRTIIY